jgi:hypothetical protein
MKDIWKALIIAFLLFVIPVIWNNIYKGALIRALGGVTREDLNGAVVTLATRDGTNRDLTVAKATEHVYVQGHNPDDPLHQWQLRIDK